MSPFFMEHSLESGLKNGNMTIFAKSHDQNVFHAMFGKRSGPR